MDQRAARNQDTLKVRIRSQEMAVEDPPRPVPPLPLEINQASNGSFLCQASLGLLLPYLCLCFPIIYGFEPSVWKLRRELQLWVKSQV